MAEQDTLRMTAEVVDKFSQPLRKLRSDLQGVRPGHGPRQIREQFDGVHKSVTAAAMGIRTVLQPALAAFGVTAIGAGGALAALAVSLRSFSKATHELSLLGRETGLTIDRMRQLEAVGARVGLSAESVRSSLSAFARNMQELRRVGDVGGFFSHQRSAELRRFVQELRRMGDTDKQLAAVLEFLDRIPNTLQRQRFLGALGLPKELGLLTGDERRKALEEALRAHGKTSKEAEQAAKSYENTIASLRENLAGLRNEIAGPLLPLMDELAKRMRDYVEQNRGKIRSGIADSIAAISNAASAAVAWLKQLDAWTWKIDPGWGNYTTAPPADLQRLKEDRADLTRQIESAEAAGMKGLADPYRARRDKIDEMIRQLEQKIEKSTKQGAEQGVREGLEKFQRQNFRGGDFGGAQVWRASVGGAAVARDALRDHVAPPLAPGGGGPRSSLRERFSALPPAGASPDSSPTVRNVLRDIERGRSEPGGDRARQVYEALRAGGLSHNQASAFLGHAQFESKMGLLVNRGEGAAGLIHWRLGRLRRLREYAASKGEAGIGSPTTQAEFALREMRTDPHESKQARRFLANPDASVPALARALRPYIRYATNTDAARAALGERFSRSMSRPALGGSAGEDIESRWRLRWPRSALDGLGNVDADEKQRRGATFKERWAPIDRVIRNQTGAQKVEGVGRLEVDFRNMPRGVRTRTSAEGMFKQVETRRGAPMTLADEGE